MSGHIARGVDVDNSLTLGDLVDLFEFYIHKRQEDEERTMLCVCYTVLHHYLGLDCTDQLFGRGPLSRRAEPGRNYFRTPLDVDGSAVDIRHPDRVFWLAQSLFNQHDVEGIERVIDDIRKGQVQASCEELEFGSQLKKAAVRFRYVSPSTEQGKKSPDIEIVLPDGQSMYCEIEGKEETTPLSPGSMYSSLEHARKQLPKGKPGLIVLKLPEEWISQSDLPDVAKDSLARFFRQTNRVVAVVFRWHVYRSLRAHGVVSADMYRVEQNEGSNLLAPVVKGVLGRFVPVGSPASWIDFREVFRFVLQTPRQGWPATVT